MSHLTPGAMKKGDLLIDTCGTSYLILRISHVPKRKRTKVQKMFDQSLKFSLLEVKDDDRGELLDIFLSPGEDFAWGCDVFRDGVKIQARKTRR